MTNLPNEERERNFNVQAVGSSEENATDPAQAEINLSSAQTTDDSAQVSDASAVTASAQAASFSTGGLKKLSKEEKHQQCMREIKGTIVVVLICCLWHIITAFALNGTGWYFLGMPAWFSVSVFGTIILAIAGVLFLLKKVFIDFEYDDAETGEEVYHD